MIHKTDKENTVRRDFEYTTSGDLLQVGVGFFGEIKFLVLFSLGQALPVICTKPSGEEYGAWKLLHIYKGYMLNYLKLA